MKILTVCDQGNNRSVQFAHILKYWKHDTLPVGLDTTSAETLKMLFDWADIILLTEESQRFKLPIGYDSKIKVFDVGADNYPRPFNAELHAIAKRFLEENKFWLKV